MLFGDIFFVESIQQEVDAILLLQNLICSAVLFLRRPKKETIVAGIIILSAIASSLSQNYFKNNFPQLYGIIYLSYFLMISYRLFVDIIKQKKVGLDTVAAVFCGFMLMAMVASMVFITVDNASDAFVGVEKGNFSSFLYFSFITLLSIGYGDITPTTEISRSLVVFFGLIGNFYTVFVIAIIVGKYHESTMQK